MLYVWIICAVILFLILFVIAPAIVCYLSVFGRRKVLPLDDDSLYKPAIQPYKERMIADWEHLKNSGFERVSATAFDGVALSADYYDRGADKTVVMVHGYNADPYVNLASPAWWLFDFGFNVLVIYHRAHGCSGGKRSGMGLVEKNDVLTWIDSVKARDASQRILLYGVSMGGATLAYLSDSIEEDRVPCMVIDCGYISAEKQLYNDAKRLHMPPLLVPLICLVCRIDQHIDIRERTIEHLKQAKKPILFLHGTADMTVPVEQGKENYEACSAEKQLVIVENAAHTVAFQTDEQKVAAALTEYINTYFD